MLNRCNDDDFYEIKMAAFDRLRPDSISVFFLGAFIFSGLMTIVLYFGSVSSTNVTHPIWSVIVGTNIVLLAIQFVAVVFFIKEKIAYKLQRIQSLLMSFISLKMSFDIYPLYFFICEDRLLPGYMKATGLSLVMGGIFYLLFSIIRGISRVQKGKLRKEGEGLYNLKIRNLYFSLPILFGLIIIGGSLARLLPNYDNISFPQMAQFYIILISAFILQYTIAYAWPEVFLFTYCKFRFESFQIPVPKRLKKKRTKIFDAIKRRIIQIKERKKKARGNKIKKRRR